MLCNLQADNHLHFAVTLSKWGKMSLKMYKDQNLEPVVKPWLIKDQDYVLKEGEHGKTQNRNIVRVWKEDSLK